jgi:predicted transcriptional regulator
MSTAKEEVRRLLDQVPDDASLEDIQYHIFVCQKIERGLKDVEAGRVIGQEEAEKRMTRWLGESCGPK